MPTTTAAPSAVHPLKPSAAVEVGGAAELADPPASTTLIKAATVAFEHHDTATAREALEEHARDFPRSKLGGRPSDVGSPFLRGCERAMKNQNHVSVRLDADTLARVDALIGQVQTEGRQATRSDVLRALVLLGLDLREAAPPAEPGKESSPLADA